jgi:L,D-peptidoglycan transpeptidase YkuD (ErfK/YbiS/YcfS/YnhG family)
MLQEIHVKNGHVRWDNGGNARAAIGRGGLAHDKREGDLATPIGNFPLRLCYFRPDRVVPPQTGLTLIPLSPYDGWCDDVAHTDYNQHVKLPFAGRHEQLWREDTVYDIIIPLGYNDAPIVPGKGSAIFFHLAHEDYRGTEGCVAIARADMLALLPQLSAQTVMVIEE